MRGSFWSLLLAVSLGVLRPAALSAADFKIGPDTNLDSLALCAGSTNYLAVWRDVNVSPPSWRASTITQTGVSGTDFAVSAAAGFPLDNAVQIQSLIFDGTNYMLVWADNRSAAPGVYARRVAPDGTLASGEIFVAPIARNSDIQPQIAYTGIDYIVAWQDNAASSTPDAVQVRYARIGTDLSVGAATSVALATSTSTQKLYAVTAGASGEALISFLDNGVSPVTTRAVRVGAANVLLSAPEGLLLTEAGFGELGFGLPLGAFYINGDYTFLTSFGTQMDSSVFRVRVLPDNTVIRSTNPLGDVPQGSTDLAENNFPRTYFNGVDEFMFARNIEASSAAYHIATKRVTLDGEDRDPNMVVVDDATKGVLNGAIVANIGAQFLVVWMDGRRVQAPARQTNIFGVFIDDVPDGDKGVGFVKAVARATPKIGIAPLTTQFGLGGSIGTIDNALWDFGDGGTATTAQPSHKYETAGDFIAVISLFRRGLAYRDFVRIFVDSATKGALGGPAETVTGAPLPPSAGVNPDLYITSFGAQLVFSKTAADSSRMVGYISPSQIPFSQVDVPVTIVEGNRTFTFTLDEFGSYNTDAGVRPVLHYDMNRFSGLFVFTTSQDTLTDVFGPFGTTNTTAVKPGTDLLIPASISYNDVACTETVSGKYIATAGKSGTFNYRLGSSGFPGSGYFRVQNVQAKETGKVDFRVHQFNAAGFMGNGGADHFVLPTTGFWRVTLGNYSEAIPVGLFKTSKTAYTYTASKKTKGIVYFNYLFSSGNYLIGWNKIDAEGTSPSGMPVATSSVLTADLILNMQLDLDGGTVFQAGDYARFTHKKIGTKTWTLR